MLLQNKNAIVYGAGGSIGAAVARTFAREGARVHLVGRHAANIEAVARDITEAGGTADAAVVDALDERAVEEHAAGVAAEAGSIDVSINLITRNDVQGTPLVDLSVADYVSCVTRGLTTNFITARAAGTRMAEQGSGVILALNSGSSHTSPLMGGTCPADSAIDALIRSLAQELGPRGVRAAGLWAAGVPESLTPQKLGAVNPAMATPEALQGVLDTLDDLRMLPASPRIQEIADLAAFLASDRANAVTGTWVNATAMFPS
ncbi:SDR family oxidoreductase [Streptomyces sp. WMMC500]|uniref:SDR family NAD(P)-dependent oxidoreductase n=1 Tax=Streptomyces sp. WMMC500 TaxID=3015154 RepID=UPI00248D37B5|nr:SDR family oxidoreductase [Streptomyces sp. WMMC500]WBB59314.1 SDR family oxidoreductase [Streptomyces sp. WMMC500]